MSILVLAAAAESSAEKIQLTLTTADDIQTG